MQAWQSAAFGHQRPAQGARLITAALFVAALSACGGGGGGDGGIALPVTPPPPAPAPSPALPPSSTLAQQCAPTNTLAPAANRNASLDVEKRWVRSYMDEAYLWYREIPTVDPALAQFSNVNNVPLSLEAYFDALRTPARTASGKLKDEFSFTFPTAEWNALSQGGTAAGFGIEWFLTSPTPPRNLTVAYVDPNTPAATANLTRGMRVVSINGVDIDTNTQAGIATINEGAFSPRPGTSYQFVFRTLAGGTVNATLTAGTITKVPVQNARVITTPTGAVGYLTFNDHIAPSEGQLVSAFTTLRNANVTDLVLDLRYNGGGFIYIASQVGFMIGGSQRTANRTFERLRFNDKRTADNNDPNNNIPFFGTSSGFANSGTAANQPLPQLNLPRVFVLTTGASCSASESIINGLRGVGVTVHLIGSTTCGKPFGFTAEDNCGISYFPIEFQGVNDQGFGDFADGFAPTCRVADDFSKPLGDATEGMLAAALSFRQSGACPAADVVQRQSLAAQSGGRLVRSIVRENKYR
ncbi:MAG: S41 family peptidase [Burkholderiaceae bacterium]|nr:S41 family peptidase [Burkholderiaceae bacterium]